MPKENFQENTEEFENWIKENMMDSDMLVSETSVSSDEEESKPPDEEEPESLLEKMRGDGKREAFISKRKSYKSLFSVMMIILSAYIAVMFFIKTRYSPITVIGDSMSPTYNNGELLRTTTKIDEYGIRYNDVICFKKEKKTVIKRVVGLPGDTVSFKDGRVYINGKLREEDYPLMKKYPDEKITLKNDEYYCLGDNRNNSKDSRVFGPVKRSEITGIVLINATKEKERLKDIQQILENTNSSTDATKTDSE